MPHLHVIEYRPLLPATASSFGEMVVLATNASGREGGGKALVLAGTKWPPYGVHVSDQLHAQLFLARESLTRRSLTKGQN